MASTGAATAPVRAARWGGAKETVTGGLQDTGAAAGRGRALLLLLGCPHSRMRKTLGEAASEGNTLPSLGCPQWAASKERVTAALQDTA